MKRLDKFKFVIYLFLLTGCSNLPPTGFNYVEINKDDSPSETIHKAAHVVPTEQQMMWQELEFTCFICLGVNTFTDREWGTGKEDPAIFNPEQLDAHQWCRVAKNAGMKLVLLTCKHHDGFCLWPSKQTDFTVASSPWRNGKGDVVKELSTACKESGLKLGVYLSPWDMNQQTYGTEEYNDFFIKQLTELLTQYGPVAEVWFDGACGEGPNGKKQIYDWERYYKTVRDLQPGAVIAIMGPDVRWVGTETGYGRETEWSVIPISEKEQKQIAEHSQQQAGSGIFIPSGDRMKKDLGSRELIMKAQGLIWYPSEVDVSIRPGWYYHENQDTLVKTPEKLVDIYYSSLGRNSILLLNLPPDKRGLIHDNDIKSLMGMKEILDQTFHNNLAAKAKIKASESRTGFPPTMLIDEDPKTYWTTKSNDKDAILDLDLNGFKTFDRLMLQENIRNGQRVEEFLMEYFDGDNWLEFTRGSTIGYKRLLRFEPITCNMVRLKILSSRDCPEINELALYSSN
jgi:alpha-L-fucosidase